MHDAGWLGFPAHRRLKGARRSITACAPALIGYRLQQDVTSMMKGKISTIVLVAVFLVGLSLLLYPTVSDYWNTLYQSKAIAGYNEAVSNLDEAECGRLWQEAVAYNQTLVGKDDRFLMTDEERSKYESLLDMDGTGIIGSIDIPSLQCSFPIYHGTDEGVLQIAIGHIEGSSLPVGGEGTHCVLSGHRGLPSARLFTDIDKLEKGDRFSLRVLNRTLTYEVDRISIVLPYEVENLAIEEGKDYCTLVTCTPYGVNSHRLLVRGHRVESEQDDQSARITSDAIQIDPLIVASVVGAFAVAVIALALFALTGRKPKPAVAREVIGVPHDED